MLQSRSIAHRLDSETSTSAGLLKAEKRSAAKGELRAVEYIRRMMGGAQSRLIQCSDGAKYIVKAQNNPQGKRILVNELLGTLLAKRLALPAPKPAVVQVSEEFVERNLDMVIELGRGRKPMHSGSSFGSRYLGAEFLGTDPQFAVHGYLKANRVHLIENITDLAGFLVFDKWTGNTDRRQTITVRSDKPGYYKAFMIDQGFCFSGDDWTFRDSPLYGTLLYSSAIEWIPSFSIFELWLDRLEHVIDRSVIETEANKVPPEWYDKDRQSFQRLLDKLELRRGHVADLVWASWEYMRKSSPCWRLSRPRTSKAYPNDARQLRFEDFGPRLDSYDLPD